MLIAVCALIASAPGSHSEPVILSFGHAAQTSHPAHLSAVQFARRVEARTNGEIKNEIFPAAELGSESEMLQRVRLGAIDLDVPSLNYLIKYEKAFAVVVIPYLFDSYEHAHRVLDGPARNWLAQLAERQGIIILSNWEWGFRNITNSKRPINTPEDLRGLKIRVPPVAELEATMAALGADVSKISFNEVHMALSQGVVDGQENPLNVIYYNKLHEVQRHLALTRHVYYNTLHVVSAKTWAKLTLEQQTILREESKAAGEMMRKAVIAEEDDLIAKMEKAGVKVTRPDPEPFRTLAQSARQEIGRFAGEENARRFLKMVEDERKR
jgi:tripartite ATP-independent transporter DctP family solute receptor